VLAAVVREGDQRKSARISWWSARCSSR